VLAERIQKQKDAEKILSRCTASYRDVNGTPRSLDSNSHLPDQLKHFPFLNAIQNSHPSLLFTFHFPLPLLPPEKQSLTASTLAPASDINDSYWRQKSQAQHKRNIPPPYIISAAKTQLAICTSPCCFHCCKIPGYVLCSFASNSTRSRLPVNYGPTKLFFL